MKYYLTIEKDDGTILMESRSSNIEGVENQLQKFSQTKEYAKDMQEKYSNNPFKL